MKESTHPFILSMYSLEAKIEKLTREFRIRQIKYPCLILLDNADFIQLCKISAKTVTKSGPNRLNRTFNVIQVHLKRNFFRLPSIFLRMTFKRKYYYNQ